MLNLHDMKEQPGQSILNLYSLLSYVCFLEIIPLMLRSFLTLSLMILSLFFQAEDGIRDGEL